MMTNRGLLRLNAALNVIAGGGFIGSALGAIVNLGGYADQLRAVLPHLPEKWLGILMVIGAIGSVAAKASKTWSQAIAAADPKAPPAATPTLPPAPPVSPPGPMAA